VIVVHGCGGLRRVEVRGDRLPEHCALSARVSNTGSPLRVCSNLVEQQHRDDGEHHISDTGTGWRCTKAAGFRSAAPGRQD
jgi:hypothetical protein